MLVIFCNKYFYICSDTNISKDYSKYKIAYFFICVINETYYCADNVFLFFMHVIYFFALPLINCKVFSMEEGVLNIAVDFSYCSNQFY